MYNICLFEEVIVLSGIMALFAKSHAGTKGYPKGHVIASPESDTRKHRHNSPEDQPVGDRCSERAGIRSLIFPFIAINSKVGYNIISHYIKVY